MHEYGIAQEMVALALEHAQAQHAEHVTKLNIEISKNADESADSLRMYLETLTQGTPAEGAQFDIQRVSALAQCLACHYEFDQEYSGEPCPQCGSPHVQQARRDEFKLTSIEID